MNKIVRESTEKGKKTAPRLRRRAEIFLASGAGFHRAGISAPDVLGIVRRKINWHSPGAEL
jgi:hypothetical protein